MPTCYATHSKSSAAAVHIARDMKRRGKAKEIKLRSESSKLRLFWDAPPIHKAACDTHEAWSFSLTLLVLWTAR